MNSIQAKPQNKPGLRYTYGMGVVKPPWITKRWFKKCPFNYCDHFGNQEILSTVCTICKDDVMRKKLYKKAGKDPYDLKNVFQDMAEDLAKTFQLIEKEAKRLGIDLDNIPDEEDLAPKPESYPIYQLMKQYGDHVEKILRSLEVVPAHANIDLILKATDVLSHSRGYVIAKTARALHSRYEEIDDEISQDLADSKTSALFTYMAIERNSRALMALARHKPLYAMKQQYLQFASLSIEMLETLREEFFPKDKLVYEEFGCEDYDECFKKVAA